MISGNIQTRVRGLLKLHCCRTRQVPQSTLHMSKRSRAMDGKAQEAEPIRSAAIQAGWRRQAFDQSPFAYARSVLSGDDFRRAMAMSIAFKASLASRLRRIIKPMTCSARG